MLKDGTLLFVFGTADEASAAHQQQSEQPAEVPTEPQPEAEAIAAPEPHSAAVTTNSVSQAYTHAMVVHTIQPRDLVKVWNG